MNGRILLLLIIFATSVFAIDSSLPKDPQPLVISIGDPPPKHPDRLGQRDAVVHLTLFSGRVGSVSGMQLGGFSNHVTRDLTGVDFTWIHSRIDGQLLGYQSVGIISSIGGGFTGFQTAGISASASGISIGMQTGGIFAEVDGTFIGIQSGGITAECGDLRGIQTAGIIADADDVVGLQAGGIVNEAQNVHGFQTAGIINKADRVQGGQVAGIVNEAGHVSGFQIGLFNHCKRLDGIAIGLVSTSDDGQVYLDGWSGGAMDYSVGIHSAPNHYWYTLVSFGHSSSLEAQPQESGFGSYLGLKWDLPGPMYIAGDLGHVSIIEGDLLNFEEYDERWSGALELRARVGLRLGHLLGAYVGIVQSRRGDNEKWLGASSDVENALHIGGFLRLSSH